MKIKIEDLKENMMGIYKLTFPNGKIYVGLSNNIKRRMYEHNNANKAKTPCDLAIVKYGKIKDIEILEFCNDKTALSSRERFWINNLKSNEKTIGYNLTKGGDASEQYGEDNVRAVFSNQEVYDIRKRRFLKERKVDVYKDYSEKSFGTFEKIWLGIGYPNIGSEFIVETGTISRQEYSSMANSGENNNKAKLNNEDVVKIRERFDNGESPVEIYKDYQHITLKSLVRVCKRETWKSI